MALEMPATVEMQIDLIKGWIIRSPRLETAAFFMCIGSARPMEDAARRAGRDLVRWLSATTGMDGREARMPLTMVGKVRVGNMVDPTHSLGASIARKYFE